MLTREQLMAFLLSTVLASIPNMPSRLKNLIALWFVLQIVVPFTAPLQTLALSDLFPAARATLPFLDLGLSALIQDLHQRDLLSEVAVVVWGEFGRTPRINANGGRDHWPRVCSAA